MDYKALLAKYIAHVGGCEGVDFIPKSNSRERKWGLFTEEELKALWECAGWDDEKEKYLDPR